MAENKAVVVSGGILTLAEAARMVGLTRERVRQLCENGTLGTVRMYGRRYVGAASLAAYWKKRTGNDL